LLVELSEEQLVVIPDGQSNNILWNIGHTIVSLDAFVYGLMKRPLPCGEAMASLYLRGTSPADWTETPDLQVVKDTLMSNIDAVQTNFEKGALADFGPCDLGFGVTFNTIEDILMFALFHEGMHVQQVNTLHKIVTP
jgi:hypothetical protein